MKAVKILLEDTKKTALSPVRWDRNDWIKFGLITGIGAGIYSQDEKINQWFIKHRNSTSKKLAPVGEVPGDKFGALSFWSVSYLAGHFYEKPAWKKASIIGLESLIITSAVVAAVKYGSQRRRPENGNSPSIWWDEFKLSITEQSFTSGHTAVAFSLATVVASEWQKSPLVPVTLYTLATFAGITRLHDTEHWATDVFFGGAIGYFTTKAVIKFNQKREGYLMPRISPDAVGLNIFVPLSD